MALSSSPSPGVESSCFPSRRKVTATSGWATACFCTAAYTAAPSVLSRFMNFMRAGVLKNRSRTMMVVPSGQPASQRWVIFPASRCRLVPKGSPAARVSRSILDTAAMAARASPRKPRVPMASRSFSVRSLLVAWRRKAVSASSGDMPQPSSVTRMEIMPPFWIATVMCFAPASTAFSSSSLTTEAGRSTTSPAAIRSATWGES